MSDIQKIRYHLPKQNYGGCADAALVSETEDPTTALYEAVIDTLATEIKVKLGEHEIFLAMLQNPDHWSEDWEALGVEDPDAFVAGLMVER